MHIYLIRHGLQDSTLCNVNISLTEVGYKQAVLTGKRLKNYNISAIYSSNLIRAMETAKEIGNILNLKFTIKEELEEIDFGELTGHTDEENKAKFEFFLEKKNKMQWDIPYPGGESNEEVFQRASHALRKIIEKEEGSICIVTHGGTIRALLSGLLGVDFAKTRLFGNTLVHGSITELYYDEAADRFSLERFNDYAHLEAYPELLVECKKKEKGDKSVKSL